MASIRWPENTGGKRSATVAPIILPAIPSTVLHSRLQCRYRKARTSAITFFIRRPERRLQLIEKHGMRLADAQTQKAAECYGTGISGSTPRATRTKAPEPTGRIPRLRSGGAP